MNEELMSKLINIKEKDISFETLNGLNTTGKLVRIVDGDTGYFVIIDRDHKLRKIKGRLSNLNTPELKIEHDKAYQARNKLIQLATNLEIPIDCYDKKEIVNRLFDTNTKLLSIKCHGSDKYGRELVELVDPQTNICINKELDTFCGGGTYPS